MSGTFVDIVIPTEHAARIVIERIDAEVGYTVDRPNSFWLGDGFRIRVTLRTLSRPGFFNFIKTLTKELGIEDM